MTFRSKVPSTVTEEAFEGEHLKGSASFESMEPVNSAMAGANIPQCLQPQGQQRRDPVSQDLGSLAEGSGFHSHYWPCGLKAVEVAKQTTVQGSFITQWGRV